MPASSFKRSGKHLDAHASIGTARARLPAAESLLKSPVGLQRWMMQLVSVFAQLCATHARSRQQSKLQLDVARGFISHAHSTQTFEKSPPVPFVAKQLIASTT